MAHRVTRAKTSPPDPTMVEDVDHDPEHDKDETTEEEILKQARDRLKLCMEVWKPQKDREKEDLQFQLPELQWTPEARAARAGGQGQAPRPMLSVSLLDQPLSLLNNQMRSADLGCQFHPVSEKASADTAEAFQGLYRFDERRSRGELARAWAFNRATKAGMGYYRLVTEYDEEGGDPADQRIVFQRILYQEGVYLDPTAAEPDFRDGEYAFITSWVPYHEFKRRWPESDAAKATDFDLGLYYERAPDWVRENPGGKGKDVLVVEYWYKVKRLEQFEVGNGEEREREVWDVYVAKIAGGWELLEDPYRWPGKYIPIIPVIGQELQNFDDKRRWIGLVYPAKDSQRAYNFAITSAIERVSLEPKAPYIADAQAIAGFEEQWDTANQMNYSVLRYNSFSKIRPDQQLPPPQRSEISTQGVSLALELAQMARDGVQSSTMIFDPSLGRTDPKLRSGRSILAMQQQADTATNGFMQSLVDVSMTYEAEMYMDLARHVYTRPGRIARIVTGDDKKVKAVMLGAPHVMDPQTKMPVPAPGNPQAKTYDLSVGHYGVSFTIGQNYQTRLQEGSEVLTELMSKMPALTVVIGDIWARFQKKPGFEEIADRLAKWREQQMPGLGDSDENQATPEMLKGEIMRGKQQMQMMGQQMQAMQHALETEQAKQQAQMAKAQLDAQVKMAEIQAEVAKVGREDETKRAIAAADNETKLLIANLANEVKVMLETLGMQREAMIADRQLENDERDRAHQAGMAEQAQAHDARKTAFGAGAKAGEAERGRQFQSREAESQRQADAESADRQREYDESQAQQTREHEAAMAAMKPAPGEKNG